MVKLLRKNFFLYLLLYIFLAIIVFCSFDIYFFGYKNHLSKTITKFLPYPALMINNELVTIREYNNFLEDYKLYLEDINKTYGQSDYESTLKIFIQDIALKQVINELDIDINEDDLNNYVDRFYENNKILHVDRKRFNRYFLKPLFYRQQILEKITEDDFNLENKKKIEEIYNELIKNPMLFDDYSDVYKDDSLGIDGNLIGWLAYGSLPESLQVKVNKMEIGDITPIMKSVSGYHIYKLNGKIQDEDVEYYQFDQIFLPIQNFNLYLENFLADSKIFYFLKKTTS